LRKKATQEACKTARKTSTRMQDRGEPVQNYEESHLQHAGGMFLYELYKLPSVVYPRTSLTYPRTSLSGEPLRGASFILDNGHAFVRAL